MKTLLDLLRDNALETPDNLAKMLDISPEEVRSRITDLEREGIIRGYQAIVNDDRLDDAAVRAVIELRIRPEREGGFDRVAERVAKFPEVISVFLMSGGYDLLLIVNGRDLKSVASFVSQRLATMQGVRSTSTHFMLKAYKDRNVLMEPDEKDHRLSVSP